MLLVFVFACLTTSRAFTTHRYEIYDNYGNHRPIAPVPRNNFAFENGNGRRTQQEHVYPKRDTESNQNIAANSDSVIRRNNTSYNYQYPYQRNGEDEWDRIAVIEARKFYNRFFSSNRDIKYPNVWYTDTYDRRQVVNQNKQEDIRKQIHGTDVIKETQGNDNQMQISTQLDDVNRSSIISEQQITQNNDHNNNDNRLRLSLFENNAIATNRKTGINSNDNINSHQTIVQVTTIDNINGGFTPSTIKPNNNTNKTYVPTIKTPDKANRPTKTNNSSNVNTNNNTHDIIDGNGNNNIVIINNNDRTDYNTKTIQDNEVTPSSEYGRTNKELDEDRWVWSNAAGENVETTTLFDLDNRDAFKGNQCPVGKVKVGKICVETD